MADMQSFVNGDPVQQTFAFEDSFSFSLKQPNFCGPMTLMLNPSLPFATIEGNQLILKPENVFNKGTYNVQLLAFLTNFREVPPGIASFKVTIKANTPPKID